MRRGSLTALTLLPVLAACAVPAPAPAPPVAHPRVPYPYHARVISRSVLQVFSGSDSGLVVGGTGPFQRNPGIDLYGLTFVDHDPATHTYFWAYGPGVKLLDRHCVPISAASVTKLANTYGNIAAVFVVYLAQDRTQVAPPKVEVWNRADGNPDNCVREEQPD